MTIFSNHIDPMSMIRLQYITIVSAHVLLSMNQLRLWRLRNFSVSPSKDLERRIYMHQIFLRKWGRVFTCGCTLDA